MDQECLFVIFRMEDQNYRSIIQISPFLEGPSLVTQTTQVLHQFSTSCLHVAQ